MMWDLIMELYEYFFYLKSKQECSHPQSTLFFAFSFTGKEPFTYSK